MSTSLSHTQISESSDRIERTEIFASTSISRWWTAVFAWFPLLVLPTLTVALGQRLPSWGFMWAMLFAIVAACKWLTWRLVAPLDRSHHAPRDGLPHAEREVYGSLTNGPSTTWRRSLAYLVAWPGMNAETFLNPAAKPVRPSLTNWMQAMGKLLFGALLVWGIVRLVPTNWPLVAGWIGMIGLAFVLHFGLFHVLAQLWQSVGIDARHIFRSPMLARSIGNLWGSRWNLAFRDLAHTFVFRPLVGRVGVFGASLATFVASGLVHELVISLPAGAGYGLPTVYFLIQWLGVVVERSRLGKRFGLRHGLVGWLFAFVVVAGPMCILFHPPFVTGVMVPFLRVIGAF